MEIGLGIMQMRQQDFWDLSPHEFYAALNGFSEFHSSGKPTPLGRDELNDLMERYPD
jgi:uncharacterized phage protein (TIGR02216 family)